MLSRNEMISLEKENALIHFGKTYWPRWLRNSMAQIVESILKLEDAKVGNRENQLQSLKGRLQLPTTQCRDLLVSEKQLVRRLYFWFSSRLDKLSRLSQEISMIPGNIDESLFSFINSEDMFSTVSGLLVPSLDDALQRVYRELQIPISYTVMRESDVPLGLLAPNENMLRALRSKIPTMFHVFCSFEINTSGDVRTDKMCIDGKEDGSEATSLYFSQGDKVLSLTAGHAVGRLKNSQDSRLIDYNLNPSQGIDIAVVMVDPLNVNPVPYSHPISFVEYARKFSLQEQVRVYKIGPRTGMTVGILETFRGNGSWEIRHRVQEVKFGQSVVMYKMLVCINWQITSPTTSIPFAVPGDSGSTIFGIHGGRFYPLGLHCCSSLGQSFAVELEYCLDTLEIGLVDNTGKYLYKNPQEADFISTRPKPPATESEPAELGSILDITTNNS
jgi:hypothetical protein